MTEITPEQALLAMEAAGLDPDKPLSEQLEVGAHRDHEALTARVAELEAKQEEAPRRSDPHAQERRFAEDFRDALNRSMTPWMGEEGDDAA